MRCEPATNLFSLFTTFFALEDNSVVFFIPCLLHQIKKWFVKPFLIPQIPLKRSIQGSLNQDIIGTKMWSHNSTSNVALSAKMLRDCLPLTEFSPNTDLQLLEQPPFTWHWLYCKPLQLTYLIALEFITEPTGIICYKSKIIVSSLK